MDDTSDKVNSHQGLKDALDSSTHHFLAWCTSDQPEESQSVIKIGTLHPTGEYRHRPAYQPYAPTLHAGKARAKPHRETQRTKQYKYIGSV